MAVETDAPETLAAELRETLAPYLQKLSVARALDDPGRPAALVVGEQKLEVNLWEREALTHALAGKNGDEWPRLVAEGYALQAKYLTEFAGHDAAGASFTDVRKNRLADDATLALVLMEQTQRAINTMVLSGRIDQAKHLSTFRNKIGHTVSAMKEQLGDQAFRVAEARSLRIAPPIEPGPVRAPIEEPRPVRKPKQAVSAPAVQPEIDEPRSYTLPLLLVLAASVVAWLIVVFPRLSEAPLHVLTVQELPHAEVIQRLSARPPSLFVEVRPEVWNGLGSDERMRVVEEIGQAARAHGYTGAQFNAPEGGPVGSWLRDKGASLVGRAASAS